MKFRQLVISQRISKKEENRVRGNINKESMISKTYQIQSDMIKSLSTAQKLMFYIKTNNLRRFKEIYYKEEKKLEEKDEHGNSLLNLAVQCNATEIALFLVDEGANVNTENSKHNCPLHYSLCQKNYKLTDYLIYKKADEDHLNEKGLTPWQYASQAGCI